MNCKTILRIFVLLSVALTVPFNVYANHGPGTTGSGSSTESGQTLKKDQFIFSIDNTYTDFESLSLEQAEQRALESEEFDALSDAFLTRLNFGFGVSDDFQIDANIGWYSGRGFIDVHAEEGEEVESAFADPEGLTDLLIRGKYRVIKGQPGDLSLIAGVSFPLGDDNERLSDGDRLEPSSQPGSGTYAVQGGLAYSKFLTPRVALSASSVFTYRFEDDDFQIGERVDTGVALAYQLSDSPTSYPVFSLFTEANYQYIGRDEEDDQSNTNSGGNTLFLTPGVRVAFNENMGFSLAPSFPVAQNQNGDQLESDFRVVSQFFFRS